MMNLSSATDAHASFAGDHLVTPNSAAPSPFPGAQRRRRCGAIALAALALIAAGCADDEEEEDDDAFVVRNTRHAAASGGTPLLGDGPWLAYLLSEAGQGATGNDFNEDGDTLDSIAVRVNTNTRVREVLDVAAEKLLIARRTLFMVVDEAADDTDWNGDMDSVDRVLLYQTPTSSSPVFLDTLDDDDLEVAVAVGGTVTYTVALAPTVDMETNLRQVTVPSTGAAPDSPVMVMAPNDPTMDGVSFTITGSDRDILFLTSDETVDGDLNGDSDATDTTIFGVLDAGASSPEAICSCLPISPASQPTAVPVTGGGEWLIAFLVDEAAQGANLNDPALFSGAWQPANCSGVPDADTADHVLHWFQLTDLAMGTATVNTGLVGAATGTAYALRSRYVGVVSPEASEGGCDLNGDSDASDLIFRWVDASTPGSPPLPVTSPARLLAVNTTIPGGSGGVVRLADTWVLSVDEAADGRDHDGEPGVDRNVIAAHTASSSGQAWNFMHGTTSPRPVGASWMAEDPESAGQFFAAFSEAFGTIGGGDGDLNGDGDATDSVPTIGEVRSGNQLTFPGVATATSRTNPGITVEENIGFHRVSEADQGSTDLNGDGDATDVVIQRFSLVNAFPRVLVATSSSVSGDSVFTGVGNAEFAAFLTEEFLENADFNGDGDTNDFVVRYLRLPE
ncbi:MAG: hypothetical protein AAGG01_01315 [Planctomycetota bacterium]